MIDYNTVKQAFDEKYRETMKLIRNGETHLDNLAEGFLEASKVVEKLLENAPNNVASVRRGRWERYHKADIGWDEWGVKCSNCGLEVEDKDFLSFPDRYCPMCGCFMLGENNDTD